MLIDHIKSTFKDAAKKLTGPTKRAFMANVTNDYFDGSSRKVESDLGWSRHTVHKGLKELETGFVCLDAYTARGRKKTEAKLPALTADIHHLVQGQSQIDPTFRSTVCYARLSARAVRQALIQEKGYRDQELPSRQTIGSILNRLGYHLKKPKKRNR
jgi:transposase